MKPSNIPAPDGCAACGHEHLVEFYENEQFLVDSVTDYVAAGLRRDGAVIVVATPEHRAAFADAIDDAGVDLATARHERRYLAIDAAEMLETFMVAGAPDPDRFRAAVIPLLESVAARGLDVRVYGEMVALLWVAGDITSTIALEDLWNTLAVTHAFSLLCGYPISAFDVQSQTSFEHICGRHTRQTP
jgi:hypothetical protein